MFYCYLILYLTQNKIINSVNLNDLLDKSIFFTLKNIIIYIFVMCDFTLRLLKNIKKKDSA